MIQVLFWIRTMTDLKSINQNYQFCVTEIKCKNFEADTTYVNIFYCKGGESLVVGQRCIIHVTLTQKKSENAKTVFKVKFTNGLQRTLPTNTCNLQIQYIYTDRQWFLQGQWGFYTKYREKYILVVLYYAIVLFVKSIP